MHKAPASPGRKQLLDPFDHISTISLVSSFRLACDTDCIDEGTAMWLLHIYRKKPAAAALYLWMALRAKS